MTRFYFHIRDSRGLIRDDTGSECESVSEARLEAIKIAKCLASGMTDVGDVVDGQTIEVTARSGVVFEVVPFNSIGTTQTSL